MSLSESELEFRCRRALIHIEHDSMLGSELKEYGRKYIMYIWGLDKTPFDLVGGCFAVREKVDRLIFGPVDVS